MKKLQQIENANNVETITKQVKNKLSKNVEIITKLTPDKIQLKPLKFRPKIKTIIN